MVKERPVEQNSSDNANKLLDRITKRYDEVDQKLRGLEKRLRILDSRATRRQIEPTSLDNLARNYSISAQAVALPSASIST